MTDKRTKMLHFFIMDMNIDRYGSHEHIIMSGIEDHFECNEITRYDYKFESGNHG